MDKQDSAELSDAIAIIGMSGRFPGAKNLEEFWRNLRDGVESVSFFSEQELASCGVAPELLRNPSYVRASAILDDVEHFDAAFWRLSPREAELMDPQHRIFMECAWEALESAGYDPTAYAGPIGVYAGSSMSAYLLSNLLSSQASKGWVEWLQILLGNDKDYLATHVSYKLNLKGPSVCVQAACSTSLVAVHLACMSLLDRECDMALAGGATVRVPQKSGYLYEEGLLLSADGHCRAFDSKATGMIYGSGAGVVVLKRLEDALANGDIIHAVIRGSAVNNDGSLKAGFSAPSQEGQASVITEALGLAGVEAHTLQYIEAHGTGTPLGDAIEAAALAQVLRASTSDKHVCAIGSVKTNIGHLDAAAGVASLIKTVLALEHRQLPPSLGFEAPNPDIDFAQGPVYVNTSLQEWKAGPSPRRAGVNSFGVGGTNAHVIVEEAPQRPATNRRSAQQGQPVLLPLSARSPEALRALADSFRSFLAQGGSGSSLSLQDVAYTASQRRCHHEHRLAVVGSTHAELIEALEAFLRGQPHPRVHKSGSQAAPHSRSPQGSPEALAALYVQGTHVDWSRLHPTPGQCVPLPSYPWQRQRYWREPEVNGSRWASAGKQPAQQTHPLLGVPFSTFASPGTHLWEARLNWRQVAHLSQPPSSGPVQLSADAFVQMATAAAQQALGPGSYEVPHIELHQPLLLSEGAPLTVQTGLTHQGDGAMSFQVCSLREPHAQGSAPAWTVHAQGKVLKRQAASTVPSFLDTLRNAPPHERERLLQQFVREQAAQLLRVDPSHIDLDTSFHHVGMDSLVGVELRNVLHSRLGVPLSIRLVWEHPTPSALARYLAEALASPGPSDARSYLDADAPHVQPVTIAPRPEQRYLPFPLTDLQQAYWLGQSGLLPFATTAVVYLEFDLAGVDLERLRAAFQRVIEHHEMLRAIMLSDGQQQILEHVPAFPFTLQDLRGKAPEEATAQLERVRHEMLQGARTDEWPLVRVRVHQLDEHGLRIHFAIPCLLVDSQSMLILTRDVARFYKDPEAPLEPLELSYRDVVLTLQSMQAEGAFRDAEDYWRRRLPSLPDAPELPLARAPSSVKWSQFQRKTGKLRQEHWVLFKQQAQRAGLTPSVAVLAAYAEVLSAWSKRPHFTLNILYQNRPPVHPKILEVFGNLGTTLLLEVDHRTPAPFEERARRIQSQLWDDLEHSQVSGIQVMRELARARGHGAPVMMPIVFTSMMHLDSSEVDSYRQAGRLIASALTTPQVWIDHQAFERGGALHFNWDVVEELFPEGLIGDMMDAFLVLLERLTDERAWSEPRFSLVPAWQLAERTAANATGAPVSEELLHTLFAAQAKARPLQEAVVDPRRRLTYGDLYRRSNQVGRRLRELGARPNTLVAIVMEKGWEQAVAALGILASGAAYLPVDPTLPPERLQYLLRNAEVKLVLTQPWLDSRLAWPEHLQRLCVDEVAFASLDEGPLSPVQGPDDLAYVIFTSGSTGLPKGVMIAHRGAVNTIMDINQRFHLHPGDRVLALSSLSFDLSVYDVFGMLAAGGTLVLPDASATRDPAHWASLLSNERITVWNSVPALMQLLVEHLSDRPAPVRPPLRVVLLSGDWIPISLPDRIRSLFEDSQVVSLGGATEASIWSILYPVQGVHPAWQSIPYGRPMKGQSFHVLDNGLEPCPVWVAGELYIGGIGLAQGYWRDEEKTRDRFITHPRTGQRLYRTGDVGRYLPGGDIEFMGRADFQVKIQGYRVELGEIEATLEKHPSLRAAVVTAVGEERGNRRLVAYVIARPGAEPVQVPALRAFLREKLPEYMVPSSFISLETLPLSPNGKVDRKALPSPTQATGPKDRSFEAPRNTTEVQLAGLWEHLLSVSPVGIHDSFFELGGNSFAAVRMVTQVQKLFGQSVSLSTLLEQPTIAQLASALRSAADAPPWSSLVGIQPAGSKPPFFCVHAVGGSALAYRELARHLGGDQPFYGLQAKGVDTDDAPRTDIREMARSYLEEVRRIQPQGPYHLGGWSFGGLVAFEMAQQLVEAGETVSELVLLDTQAPAPSQEQGIPEVALLHLLARDLGLPISRNSLSSLTPGERLAHLNEVAISSGLVPSGIDESTLQRLVRVYSAHLGAAQRYAPRPYSGRLRLLRAQEPLEERAVQSATQDPTWGWATFAPGPVTVEFVPGDHFTMVREPHVRHVAETLLRFFQPVAAPFKTGEGP